MTDVDARRGTESAQDQFLNVVDRDVAERRLHEAIDLRPLGTDKIAVESALGRILAADVTAAVDVPSFDRSNLDGFAVQAADTYGATESAVRRLHLHEQAVPTGEAPTVVVQSGTAVSIATGGMLPRGADAILMVEHADVEAGQVVVRRAVTPGAGVAFAGTDIAAGETVLRRGQLLTSRETGVLSAIGVTHVDVYRLPRVAIISTGNEIIAPGQPMRPGRVYDSNARILADAVAEAGGRPENLGIVPDDFDMLRQVLLDAIARADVVLLSGGTSKGAGDICYRVVAQLRDPGIVAHGVALKPGKPICLAATGRKPVIVLPGFPTSAVFTFHEFVAPVIRRLAGQGTQLRSVVTARMAVKVNSEIGRTEYLLVGLVQADGECGAGPSDLVAFPMGKGSGSVTTFSGADGFVTIPRHDEIVEAGTIVDVQLLGRDTRPADLVVIGSHCPGLDILLGRLQEAGYRTKFLSVGSTAGLQAALRGQCDVAGIHLLDDVTGQYNRPFLTPEVQLIPGYGRLQGVVFRPGDSRFEGLTADEAIARVEDDPQCLMVNRNQGSGTRALIDQLLGDARPPGYAVQPRSHNAVAAAVTQGRADWGLAIQTVARRSGLGFLPLTHEQFDFVVPKSRCRRPAVVMLAQLLADPTMRQQLQGIGMKIESE